MRAPFRIFVLATVVALSVGTTANAQAQHEGHQMPSAAAVPVTPNPACALGAQKALAIVEAATQRLETARTTSSPADLRTTISEVQTAVAVAQAQLFTCRAAVPTASAGGRPPEAMAGMDHSRMNMRASPAAAPAAAGAKPADPMAGMDHSKMNMGKPAPSAKPAASGVKPADPMAGMDHSKMNMGKPAPSAKPAAPGVKAADPMAGMDHSKMNMGKPAAGAKSVAQGAKPPTPGSPAPMAGMDHSKMPMGSGTATPGDIAVAGGSEAMLPVMMAERIADPACPNNVGQATAPKAVYELKVYYFCSTAARDEFRKDPAAYLKKHPR